jgi:hypothetical protein
MKAGEASVKIWLHGFADRGRTQKIFTAKGAKKGRKVREEKP